MKRFINKHYKHLKKMDKKKKCLFLFIMIAVMIILLVIGCFVFIFKTKPNNFSNQLNEKGFSYVNESFICDAIKKKSHVMMSTRKYSIIAINGEVYDMSFTTKYTDDQNCEKRDFPTKVVAHIDNVVVGEDKKFYNIYDNLSVNESIKYPYDISDIVLKVDRYILKKDGNIYYQDSDDKIGKVKYKASSLDGKIQSISLIGSDYEKEDEKKIVVMTDKAVYYSYSENEEECRIYANTKCNYTLKKDKFLSKNRKNIFYVDDTVIITKEGKVYYTNDYFGA